ncbi:MAG TPA: hypothetical protein VGR03_06835, partial [Candidatus Acidoferrum sp.]|nr:hypothetical protein [Candidatus Acidoferrum sp.]
LLLFFRLTLKNLDKRILEHSGWMQLGATLAVCGLLVHSFIDFNLHIPANAAWFSACVGMAQRNLVSSRREGKVDARWVN